MYPKRMDCVLLDRTNSLTRSKRLVVHPNPHLLCSSGWGSPINTQAIGFIVGGKEVSVCTCVSCITRLCCGAGPWMKRSAASSISL